MIKAIVAYDKNNIIGINGNMPWYDKEDLAWFRSRTYGSMVVMGRKTADSLNNTPLFGRKNLVLSRSQKEIPGFIVCNSIEHVIDYYMLLSKIDEDLWVIGGEEIYRQMLYLCNEVYATERHEDSPYKLNDKFSFFPKLNMSMWDKEILKTNEQCTYAKYIRKTGSFGY